MRGFVEQGAGLSACVSCSGNVRAPNVQGRLIVDPVWPMAQKFNITRLVFATRTEISSN